MVEPQDSHPTADSAQEVTPEPPSTAPKTSDESAPEVAANTSSAGFEVEGDVFRGVEHQSTVLETGDQTYQLGAFGYDYLDRRVRARIEVLEDVLTLQQQGKPVTVFAIEDIGPAQVDHPGSEL